MAIRSTDSLLWSSLWSCAPDAPALSRCRLAVVVVVVVAVIVVVV